MMVPTAKHSFTLQIPTCRASCWALWLQRGKQHQPCPQGAPGPEDSQDVNKQNQYFMGGLKWREVKGGWKKIDKSKRSCFKHKL